jgi:hypothetical protein
VADAGVEELREAFTAVLDDIGERSSVADRFIDRDVYQLYLATLWANVVLNPDEVGLTEAELPALHEVLNERLVAVLGEGASVTECFRFVNSKRGERAMQEASLTKTHKDLLLYFCSMILDPEGHQRWMEELAEDSKDSN